MTTVFQIPAQKYPNKELLVRNLRIFFLHQTLEQDIFEDHDLKHDNNIFKFQPRNTPISHFLSQI